MLLFGALSAFGHWGFPKAGMELREACRSMWGSKTPLGTHRVR